MSNKGNPPMSPHLFSKFVHFAVDTSKEPDLALARKSRAVEAEALVPSPANSGTTAFLLLVNDDDDDNFFLAADLGSAAATFFDFADFFNFSPLSAPNFDDGDTGRNPAGFLGIAAKKEWSGRVSSVLAFAAFPESSFRVFGTMDEPGTSSLTSRARFFDE